MGWRKQSVDGRLDTVIGHRRAAAEGEASRTLERRKRFSAKVQTGLRVTELVARELPGASGLLMDPGFDVFLGGTAHSEGVGSTRYAPVQFLNKARTGQPLARDPTSRAAVAGPERLSGCPGALAPKLFSLAAGSGQRAEFAQCGSAAECRHGRACLGEGEAGTGVDEDSGIDRATLFGRWGHDRNQKDLMFVSSAYTPQAMRGRVPVRSAILHDSGGSVQISFGNMMLKSKGNLIVLAAIGLASCSSRPEQSPVRSSTPEQPPVIKADKPFVAAGNIEMRLSGGDYIIRAGTDEHIRISFGGNTGNAAAEVTTSGTRANLSITDTPHSNFRATVEVPQRRTSPSISPAAMSRSPESRGTKISTARPETSRFRSQTPMITVQWMLLSRWGISTGDPLVILAQDSPRTSNGRALASTPCAPVWAPATWN